MYWGTPWIGGTASVGVPAPWHSWHFAEGAAQARFETFYLIQNANPVPITVNAAFFTEDGQMLLRSYPGPASSRSTVYLNAELGNVGGVAASFSTAPETPVVVERAVYWGLGMEVPEKADVDLVGDYKPTMYGFGGFRKGVKPADLVLGK